MTPKLLEASYGGKAGFVQLQYSRVELLLGRYRLWQNVELSRVEKLVFVCRGNISRSPYSAYRAVKLGLPSASYGLEADNDKPAEQHALHNAAQRAIDLSGHRACHLSHYTPDSRDLLLCYEPAHALRVQQCVEQDAGSPAAPQVSLVGLWSRPRRPLIFDPYGLHDQYYQTCYACIDSALDNLAEQIALSGSGAAHG